MKNTITLMWEEMTWFGVNIICTSGICNEKGVFFYSPYFTRITSLMCSEKINFSVNVFLEYENWELWLLFEIHSAFL